MEAMKHKYELEELCDLRGELYMHALVKVLTGLEYDEIEPAINKNKNNGQGVINIFRDLGFNVTPKFKKFDPDTEYPAMIRCKSCDDKSHWYPFVYYDGKVYAPHHGGTYPSVELFLDNCRDLKITSMIQVWI